MCNSDTVEKTGAVSVPRMTVEELIAQVKASRINGPGEPSWEESVVVLPVMLEQVLELILSEFNYLACPGSQVGQACRILALMLVDFNEKIGAIEDSEGGGEE